MAFRILFLFLLSFTQESMAVSVAVLDTGIDLTKYPYKNQIQTLNEDFQDHNGHGTHVASIILERTPKTTVIVPIKVFELKNKKESVREMTVEESKNIYTYRDAIIKASKKKIRIVNISAGGSMFFKLDYEEMKKHKNMLFVVASGNYIFESDRDGKDLDYFIISKIAKKNPYNYNYYPCAFQLPNIICVGSADTDKITGKLKVMSNYGSMVVDVFANGNEVLAHALNGEKQFLSGSSMATSKITALAVNELSKNPKLSTSQLKKEILKKLTVDEELKDKSKLSLYLHD